MAQYMHSSEKSRRYNHDRVIGMYAAGLCLSALLLASCAAPDTSANPQYASTATAIERLAATRQALASKPNLAKGKIFTITLGEVACKNEKTGVVIDIINPVLDINDKGDTKLGYMSSGKIVYANVTGQTCNTYPRDGDSAYQETTKAVTLTAESSDAAVATDTNGQMLHDPSGDPLEVAVLTHSTK